MRAMTIRKAIECETAATVRCRCRCAGALHGARRTDVAVDFHDLDEADPHYVPIPPRRGRQLSLDLDLPAAVRLVVPPPWIRRDANGATGLEPLSGPHTGLTSDLRLAI